MVQQSHLTESSVPPAPIAGDASSAPPAVPPDAPSAFLRKVLDASLNAVYVHDVKAGINTFISGAYTRLTGYRLEQLAGMSRDEFAALFHPDDRTRVLAHSDALRTAADADALEIEYRFRRADGIWIWCLSRDTVFARDADGSVRSILGTFVDVSARRQAEDDLRAGEAEARARLREIELIYDSVPIGLCVLDRELRYLRVNSRLAEINGVPATAHIGRTVREVLPGLADDVEPRMRRVLETGEPLLDVAVSGETAARPGVQRTWIESWFPLRGEDGRVVGINIVAKDVTEERNALTALAESRERWRLVADFTYDWEYWVGADGRVRWMSPSCERITGYGPDRFLADPELLARIVHPDDRPTLEAHLRADLREPEPARLQFRVRRADGAIRWLEHICQPVFTADGRFAGRRASTRDVTNGKQAEEELRQREREFASLVENSPDIVVRFDRELRHRYVNAAVERATGRRPAEFLGKTNEELGMPPELCERWSANLRAVFRTGEPQGIDFSFPAPDRERFYSLRAVPEYGPDGQVETVLATTRDETARREAEAQVRTLAAVVETSRDFIGVAALDGRAMYLNRAGQVLVGLDGDEAVRATRVEDYLFPEDLPFLHTTVLPAVMQTGRWTGEFRFRHFRSGEPIDVRYDVVRIDDPETGRPVQLATVTRDIRTEKAAEAAFLETSRRKDEFMAVLGHELRNPMAPIRNAVDILRLLKQIHDPRMDWALDVLDRQSAHLSRLLDDLLDVSRIVRGKLRLERRPVELREVMQQAADGVDPLMSERQHRLDLELPAAEVVVDADPARLYQILLNLLLNAAKYTDPGGHIRLTAEADTKEVVVRVQDNGPGIPPEQLEDLFTPFTQSEHQPRPPGLGGLGLGLTISRSLAELHGGRLAALSHWPRRGTEFSLYLPRRAAERPPPQPAAPEPKTRSEPLSVLVVEDNADVAGALSMLLDVLGYRVQTAETANQALELTAASCPRVALLDIGLPDMDGLELARQLRARYPDKSRLMLVALTGYGHQEARERSFAAGFDEHLAKPVDLATLKALFERVG